MKNSHTQGIGEEEIFNRTSKQKTELRREKLTIWNRLRLRQDLSETFHKPTTNFPNLILIPTTCHDLSSKMHVSLLLS